MKCKYCNEKDATKYSKYSSGNFCSKACANSYSSNLKRKEINEFLKQKNTGKRYVGGKLIEAKTKTRIVKERKIRVDTKDRKRFCKACGIEIAYYSNKSGYCKSCVVKTDWYLSKLRHPKKDSSRMGGPRPGGGKSKCHEYVSPVAGRLMLNNDEIVLAKSLDSIGVKWKRNWFGFRYIDLDGKERKYYPDFYVEDYDSYVEYKGWVTDKINNKMQSAQERNDFKLLVIYSNDKRYRDLGLNLETIEKNPKSIVDNLGR